METQEQIITKVEKMARIMRKHALKMTLSAGSKGAHVGPGLSIIDITATLWCHNEIWPLKIRNGKSEIGLFLVRGMVL